MNHTLYRVIFCCTLAFVGFQITGCKKNKPAVENTAPAATQEMPADEPVVIAPDAELTTNVTDAVKDFPGVQAAVNNGEVTLTGTISRDRLPALMQSLHALQPKKINNNLTIK